MRSARIFGSGTPTVSPESRPLRRVRTASAVLTISRRLVQAPASEIAARRLDVVARRVLFVIERIAIADHAQVRRPA
jgi:hypothetical protein